MRSGHINKDSGLDLLDRPWHRGIQNPKPRGNGANSMYLWAGHISPAFEAPHSSKPKIVASIVGGCGEWAARK